MGGFSPVLVGVLTRVAFFLGLVALGCCWTEVIVRDSADLGVDSLSLESDEDESWALAWGVASTAVGDRFGCFH